MNNFDNLLSGFKIDLDVDQFEDLVCNYIQQQILTLSQDRNFGHKDDVDAVLKTIKGGLMYLNWIMIPSEYSEFKNKIMQPKINDFVEFYEARGLL